MAAGDPSARVVLPEGSYRLALRGLPDELAPTDEPSVGDGFAVLPVRARWMVLRAPAGEFGLAPLRQTMDPDDPRHVVTLVLVDPDDDPEWGMPIAACLPGGAIERTERGYRGDGWSLEPHACERVNPRAWTWIDPPTWPGSALRIRHRRPVEGVRAWLLDHAPLPYEETAPNYFEDGEPVGQRAHLALHPGLVELHHFHGTREALDAFTGALLLEIAGGVLGPVVWDVSDEDWHVYLAAGDDGASLGRYLDRNIDAAAYRAQRQALITPRIFEVHGATTRLALLQGIAVELGLGEIASIESFGALLRERPTGELPRSWLLRVHPTLGEELSWLAEVVFAAQPRLRLSWQVV